MLWKQFAGGWSYILSEETCKLGAGETKESKSGGYRSRCILGDLEFHLQKSQRESKDVAFSFSRSVVLEKQLKSLLP